MADRLSFTGGRTFVGGRLVEANLNLEEGRVSSVGDTVPRGARVVDARGRWLLPAAVDVHVHSREPGFPDKETFATLTAAAAAGGVTSVLDMPNTVPAVDRAEVLAAKAAQVEAGAWVDFGLYGLLRAETTPQMVSELAAAGAVAFKAYLGYAWRRSTGEVLYVPNWQRDPDLEPPPGYATLERLADSVAATGLPLVVHCEDPALLRPDVRIRTYADLLRSRPDEAEAEAVRRLVELARRHRTHFHVAHLSSAAGLAAAAGAPSNLTLEVSPNHLWRTASDFEAVGNPLKMYPPVRGEGDRDALRRGLCGGEVPVVATDHAPHTDTEKLSRGLSSALPGSPGVQTLLVAALAAADGGGCLEPGISAATANPAAIFQLSGKGQLQPGADGDVVVIDPTRATRVEARAMLSRQTHAALEGLEFPFRVEAVYLRGRPPAAGRGRWLRPKRRAG